jgi:diguanylate cyclase (GGDEF)-like protein
MLTGHEDMDTKLAALDAGFDDFVAKSAAEVEIVAKLAAARRVATRQRTMDVAIRELYGLATRDELTGLFNRRFFMAEAARLLAQDTPVSVILFDLDDFKQVNDTHGHLAGDRVLRDIGALFHRCTRPEDIVARFGGDELVMAIPQLALHEIERVAERLSRDVHALRWVVDGAAFTLGISTGIASSHLLPSPTLLQILNIADGDMYKNKWLRKHSERQAGDGPASDRFSEPAVTRKTSGRGEVRERT